MNSNNGYGRFALFYDSLMQADYDKISNRIDSLVMEFYNKRGILLDLACGTGTLCEKMAKMGYDVVGVDTSQEMLSVALDKKYDSGLPIQYLCQDMRKIDMFGTIDVTVCTLDSINHLACKEDVFETFKKVSLFAEPEGLFIFDVNTPYKHKFVLADNTFVFENDEVYCVWQNFLNDDNSVDISLDLFEKDGESYFRASESFSEISIPLDEIKNMLCESGFEVLGVYDGYENREVSDNSERAVFVARKIK
ncbi:MAG: class I SAM-dependent methyltransferase [Oscillospiraceae bacterium]|nr:class I SAM-dependent methyltransferase [Oscillospiraceae bacterium]